MERVHPSTGYAAACAMFALALGLGGCRSSSNGIAGSPFMSPDRVPPPNTRAILPGQAQPYYQGDPLPAMQSAANAPTTTIAALPSEVETRTASGRTLAWTQPGATAAPPNPTSPAPAAPVLQLQPQAQPQPQQMATMNENSVAVPNDADPLRFPLPAPEVAPPIASAVPIPTPVKPVQPAGIKSAPSVLQASYNAPIPSALPLQASAPIMNPSQPVASPWRSPQVAQAAVSPATAPQPIAKQPSGTMPLTLPSPPAIPSNTIAATLRAVESPAQPGDPIPRIRMPGYVASQVSADGFRPRTSMQ
jgi:hypothetical protein